MKKSFKKVISLIISLIMIFSLFSQTILAAPASDLPDNMVDSHILRALEYTGYDVQTQKNNGTLYQYGGFGGKEPASIRSGIKYGTNLSGKETVSDSSTVTGLAPDIEKFEKNGLCCAAFVTYFVCNYLPNIEGSNTSIITNAINASGMNSQAVLTWQTVLNNLVSAGSIEKIGTSPSNVNRNKLTPGDLIIFGDEQKSYSHIAVYSGTYKGNDFIIHVGDDNGPQITRVDWMSDPANGAKTSTPNAYYHLPEDMFQQNGEIEIYKKNTDGANLSGAVFVATSTTDSSKQFKIGPTNSSGYAITEGIPYGTYKVKETVFPTNYRSYGQTEWNVTVSSSNNGIVTVNAVNEIIPGNIKIVKTSEDSKVENISFTVSGTGVNKKVKTNSNGEVTVKDLKPGTYNITETVADKYEPQNVKRVTVVSGQTSTVTFNNVLKRGNLTVTKTSEDGLVEGMEFRLYGTSLSGLAVNEYGANKIIRGKPVYKIINYF